MSLVTSPRIQRTSKISNFFTKETELKNFIMPTGSWVIVPDGKQWLAVGGEIVHTTATDSVVAYFTGESLATAKVFNYGGIDKGTSSGTFPLFANVLHPVTATLCPFPFTLLPIPGGAKVYFAGGVGSSLSFTVIETDAI